MTLDEAKKELGIVRDLMGVSNAQKAIDAVLSELARHQRSDDRFRSLAEGLECQEIDSLMDLDPEDCGTLGRSMTERVQFLISNKDAAERAFLEAVNALLLFRDDPIRFCGASSADHIQEFCECETLRSFTDIVLLNIIRAGKAI
ncbi:MAG: hypothetical protein ABL984_05395 [Pyrinomonadaceae bacterium]